MSDPAAPSVDAPLVGSRALREAMLASELRRACAVTAVLVLVLVPMVALASRRGLDAFVPIVAVVGGAVLFSLQAVAVVMARRAARRDRVLPVWFAALSVAIESLVPTGVIVAHVEHRTFPAYTALIAPSLLAYGLVMCLTTLRLRPALCLLSGTVSAAGYTGALLYVRRVSGPVPDTGLPVAAYANIPALLLISGVAAAWVAGEIRGYMEAALGEAETRRRMDRIERDLSVARSIQQALLPRTAPAIPGFDIAGWNRPADQTGGDYYDWHRLPDGHWIISLADVSGHGIGPALVTAACRAYMRASSAHHPDLASLASRVNRLLADDLPDGRFVTMVSVLIDPRGQAAGAAAGALAMLSAGHGPIVLYIGATGEVRDILPGDVPLAITPDLAYAPAQIISLAPGDMLALVTDGFVEWSRPINGRSDRREAFGMARLRESLRRHAHRPASQIIEGVAADVAAFAGPTPQQDDLTMVLIRRSS